MPFFFSSHQRTIKMTEINSYDNELNNFLIKQKELFLVDLNNKNELKNWCICIGNEAGGK